MVEDKCLYHSVYRIFLGEDNILEGHILVWQVDSGKPDTPGKIYLKSNAKDAYWKRNAVTHCKYFWFGSIYVLRSNFYHMKAWVCGSYRVLVEREGGLSLVFYSSNSSFFKRSKIHFLKFIFCLISNKVQWFQFLKIFLNLNHFV